MAGQTDLPRANWFGEFEEHVTFHVIDSIRPLSLDSLFMGDRIFVWDDGNAQNLVDDLKISWEIVTVCFPIPWVYVVLNQLNYQLNPRPPDDDESSDEDLEGEERSDDDLSQEDGDPLSDTGTPSKKRQKPEAHAARKRRRMDDGVRLFYQIRVPVSLKFKGTNIS